MKRTHKKVLGLFCLGLVVAMTIFAACLPVPETQAADVTSVTDTLQIRVVGTEPRVVMSGITNGSVFITGEHSVTVTYEDIEYLYINVTHTGADGVEYTTSLLQGDDGFVDYNAGEVTFTFDFLTGEYSYVNQDGDTVVSTLVDGGYRYGEYTIDAKGVGWDGVESEDNLAFSLYPAVGSVDRVTDGDYYKYYLDLDYDEYESDTGGEVTTLVVKVYDANGNEVAFSPITVNASTKRIELPFSDYGLEDGTYTIEIYAYGYDNLGVFGLLYAKPYEIILDYVGEVPKTPDTGGFFKNLNISNTDYLVTGLIVFGLVAVCGTVFIVRNDKKRARLGSRRRK